jgi:hypothetical protein
LEGGRKPVHDRLSKKNMSSTEWTYHMTISNQTGETLVAQNEERNWGIWYLGGKDKSGPVSIGAGETKEVFGIRASKGTATGYQGQCTWIGASGSLTLSIEVPYSKDNKSSLKVSGMYNVDGWSELPPRATTSIIC